MADFSLMPDSEEKQGGKLETNRNIDETFDASPFVPRILAPTGNRTIVLDKAELPSSSKSLLKKQDSSKKHTPSHFMLDSMPCHSTPLNHLSDCLEMVAPLVDGIEHHDGAGVGVDLEVSADVDGISATRNSNKLLEADVRLQASSAEVPISSFKVKPLKLTDAKSQTNAKPTLKPKPVISAKQSVSQSKVSKPKLPTAVLGGKQAAPKHQLVKSQLALNSKPPPKEMLLARRSSAIGNTPKTKSPLLKVALSRPSNSSSKPPVKQPSQVPKAVHALARAKPVPSALAPSRQTTTSSKSNASGSSAGTGNRQVMIPKSGTAVLSTRKVESKITNGLKTDSSHFKKPSSTVSTGGRLSLDTVPSKNPPENKSERKVLQKSVSSLSEKRPTTSSLPKVSSSNSRPGLKTDSSVRGNLSNNNIPKSNATKSSLGARPKNVSNLNNKTSSIVPKTSKLTENPTKSTMKVNPSNSTKDQGQSRLASSNSFIAQEVSSRPSLPLRSLSNVTSGTSNLLARRTSDLGAQTGRSSPSRMLRVPSVHHPTPRSSQPDLLKITTPRPDLEREVVKVRSCLAAKSAELDQAKDVLKHNNFGFDALAIVTKNLIDKTEKQVETLKQDVDVWKSRYQSLQVEVENSKQKHKLAEEDFNKLLTQLGKDIETMCRKHDEEKDTMKEANRCQIEAQRLEFQEEMRKRKLKNENDAALLRERHKVELMRKEKSNELNLANEKNVFQIKESEMKKSCEIEKDDLKETIQQLESKVSALVINLMNGPDHRDGAMAEMQKEIDSLRAVVEMRNDDIKSVNEENQRLRQKMSSFKEMKDKVRNLSSQVEDMKELLAVKRTNERKLDAELQQLQESMHKTSREKRRLSIEKEQLEWRMKQRIPLQRLMVEETQSHSFSGETQHSRRNFKTFHFRSPSLNNTEPLPLPPYPHPLDLSPPPSSSTPSVVDYRTSRASVSYNLDLSGSRTPGSAVRLKRARRLDTGLGDRQ